MLIVWNLERPGWTQEVVGGETWPIGSVWLLWQGIGVGMMILALVRLNGWPSKWLI